MNREIMIATLRARDRWFTNKQKLQGGWVVLKNFVSGEFVVCHHLHDPINKRDLVAKVDDTTLMEHEAFKDLFHAVDVCSDVARKQAETMIKLGWRK